MNKIEIDYSTYDVESDEVSQELLDLIEKEYGDELYLEDNYHSGIKVRNVESPFILADNYFDLREANNDIIEIGVEIKKTITFNGGAFYNEYIKVSDPAIVVHGNGEEGYNIFILN